MQGECMTETSPLFIVDEPFLSNSPLPPVQSNPLLNEPPQPLKKNATIVDAQPIKPLEPPQPPEEMLFASLYQKEACTGQKEEAPFEAEDGHEEKIMPTQTPLTEALTIMQEIEKRNEKPQSQKQIIKQAYTPPVDSATDDIPMSFQGIDTPHLSGKDSLFHTFIKVVNTALYKSMQESNPPFTPGLQPLIIRIVIVRTGKLAQRPTILRSSGNPQRDAWYIDAIVRASSSFPPIPAGLHLPFAEMMFKEGNRSYTP